MLTSKQRAYLRGLASTQDDVAQVGKEGLNDACLEGIEKVLNARELIKIKVLPNCDYSVREIADMLEEKLKADVVGVVGYKVMLYKYSNKKDVKHLNIKV